MVTERARTLKAGGILLGLVIAGLVIGFVLVNRGDDGPSPSASPTSSPDIKAQAETAYLHAWDIWADAMRRLDPSRLPEAMTGNALDAVRQQVADAKSKNEPVRIQVEHNYTLTIVNSTTVSVDDNYINHSVRLDPNTGEPKEPVPNKRVHKSFTMRLVGGTWKLAEIIGFES